MFLYNHNIKKKTKFPLCEHRVKGDHQFTKDIGKTYFDNANFNNPDIKRILHSSYSQRTGRHKKKIIQ